jgi:hypothetical protein
MENIPQGEEPQVKTFGAIEVQRCETSWETPNVIWNFTATT